MKRISTPLSMTFVIWFCTALILCQSGCKDNPVDAPIKNPREYTWTIDTISYPGSYQTMMQSIWGSSPSDVYIVGHNDQNRGLMWHYDGKQWIDVKLSTTQGGSIAGSIDLHAIYGFAANAIFAVGEHIYQNPSPPPNFLDSSLIIRFDGSGWKEQKIGGRLLERVWGSSIFDIWTGGWTNKVYHYGGSLWQKDSLPVAVPGDGSFSVISIAGDETGQVYVLGLTQQSSYARTTNYFFRRETGKWKMVDSALIQPGLVENKWGDSQLWMSTSHNLYSVGAGVFRWDGSAWLQIYASQASLAGIFGTSDQNVFVVGPFGTVLHCNGSDWFGFKQLQDLNAVYTGVWTNGSEVFIVGFTASSPQKTLILHGK